MSSDDQKTTLPPEEEPQVCRRGGFHPVHLGEPLIMKLAEIGQQLSDPTVTDAMIRTAVVDCAQTFKDVEESFGTQDAEPQPDYHNMTFTMKLERIWGQQYHIIPLCLTASTD